ncbi:hypothetical protein EG346_16745 [Chryseobacterium carnipullorum]|uniref:ASCH domain-containing protein n=1 Tax=Chryseobacterium carnipullorum TaxID=1124835 RepID=A0A376DTK7_CHRCU|nr:hypothetical protein [Chryseobacterium carnipullorum]AZA49725.1 hypothetical protein EG346_16745 [Chryseobacterium carnipullorum]AZA64615.1 hypothetical protein EG345_07765 [Chryseobacterium carnipullorum]STC95433.1 Uncharacterised protein [Chryseobacterium carnipullorum]
MKNTKELYLILTKKWFLEILTGVKKEEYRSFTEYYVERLGELDKDGELIDTRKYETIKFQLGYRKNAPQMIVECKDVLIEVDEGVEEELNEQNSNFVIVLGEILEKINCESLNV